MPIKHLKTDQLPWSVQNCNYFQKFEILRPVNMFKLTPAKSSNSLSSEVSPKENSVFIKKRCAIYIYEKEPFVVPWILLGHQLFKTC